MKLSIRFSTGIIYLLMLWIVSEARRILIFTSPLNVHQMQTFFDFFDFGQTTSIEYTSVSNSAAIDTVLNKEDYYYTVDLTEDISLTQHLIDKARENQRFNFVFGRNNDISLDDASDYTFHGSLTFAQTMNLICDVFVASQDTSEIALLMTASVYQDMLLNDVDFCYDSFKKTVYLSNTYEVIQRQVGYELKAEGIHEAYLLTQEDDIALNFLTVVTEKFMAVKGFSYTVISESLHANLNAANDESKQSLLQSGLMMLIEKGTETAIGPEEVQAQKIKQLMNSINTAITNLADITSQALYACCYDSTDNTINPQLSYLNSQGGAIVTVGTLNSTDFDYGGTALYPGGATTFDGSGKIPIKFTYYDGLSDYYETFGLSSDLALYEVPLKGILPAAYELKPNKIVSNEFAGITIEDVVTMFTTDDGEGVLTAFFGICTDALVLQIYQYEWAMYGQLPATFPPHFFPFSILSAFHDKTTFPNMNPLAYTLEESARVYTLLFDFMKWTRAGVFYDIGSGTSTLVYQYLFALFNESGIEIIGDPALHQFDSRTQGEADDKEVAIARLKPILDEIIESRIRVLCFMTIGDIAINWIVEYLYNAGLRTGDYIVINLDIPQIQLLPSQIAGFTDLTPFWELYDYSLFIIKPLASTEIPFYAYIQSFVQFDEQGRIPSSIACWNYDSMYHLAYGLQYAISRGADYEVPSTLNTFLRGTRFTGCNGNVGFETETNARKMLGYFIKQYRADEENSTFRETNAGAYNPLSSPFFTMPNVEWKGGVDPTDTRPLYGNCDFEEYLLQDHDFGIKAMYGAGAAIVLGTAISCMVFIFLWRKVKVNPVPETYFGMGDIIFALASVFEFVQILSLAPGLPTKSDLEMVETFSVYPRGFFDFETEPIYFQTRLSFAIIGLSVITVFILACPCFKNKFFIFRFLTTVPIGYIFFIPVMTMLMDLFICTEEAKDEAFFELDCNTKCWTDEHKIYLSISGFGLLFLVPSVIYIRIRFQEILFDLNILQRPSFMIIKTGIIVVMTVASKIYDVVNFYMHIAVLVGGWGLVIILMIVLKAYNYNRVTLYMVTLGAIYIIVIVGTALPIEKIIMVAFILALVFISLATMAFLQLKKKKMFPQLLYMPKQHKIGDMIRFQFLTKNNAEIRRGQTVSEFIGTIRHKLRTVHEHGDGAQSVTHLMSSQRDSRFDSRSNVSGKTNLDKTVLDENDEKRALR